MEQTYCCIVLGCSSFDDEPDAHYHLSEMLQQNLFVLLA